MQAFTTLTSKVLPLDRANVDTDAIIPKQFLKSIRRSGFGVFLFDEWRYLDRGEPEMNCTNRPLNQDFILNKPQYKGAQILLTRENFGCGSSREHAPWALEDYGFRAIIAPSFADIFYNNCFKNGLLPITLNAEIVNQLFNEIADGYQLTIDLAAQTITTPNNQSIHFEIDDNRKHRLLNGLDDIGLTLQQADKIKEYEKERAKRAPWLFIQEEKMIQTDNFDCLVKKESLDDYHHNCDILKSAKENIENNYLTAKLSNVDFVTALYQKNSDDNWFLAQCQSICNQIEKLINPTSDYNKDYINLLKEEDKISLTEELISDICHLEKITSKKIIDGFSVITSNYLSSPEFFLHAKFSYFTHPPIAQMTRPFYFYSMPTLIRQAIELKIKYMIGLKEVTKNGGGFMTISKILQFCCDNPQFFDMPVSFETLKAINTWTNSFIHTGRTLFCWQSLEAIDLIEPLFSTENKKNNSLSLYGFSYLAKGVSLSDLQTALNSDKDLKATFTLDEKYLEGDFLYSEQTI